MTIDPADRSPWPVPQPLLRRGATFGDYRPGDINVVDHNQESSLVISVSDAGRGMLDIVFFNNKDGIRKIRPHKERGIGLAVYLFRDGGWIQGASGMPEKPGEQGAEDD